ncbi:hypothetical protein H2248_004817 [Termitomyces sp. 'cryptogamus']|nr:hypothetical protein H2248_004817 [Termitomyces sp. 'cryptogamus']
MLLLINYTQAFVSSIVSYVLQVYRATQSRNAVPATTMDVLERITITLDELVGQVEAISARLVDSGQALGPCPPVINCSGPGPCSHASPHDYREVLQTPVDLVYAQRECLAQERRDAQLVGQLRLQNVLLMVLLLAVTFVIIRICRCSAPRVPHRQRRNPTLANTQSFWRQHAGSAPFADTQTSTRS